MIEIRALRSDDDRSSFSSGDSDLDRFLKNFAGQYQFRHHIGVTYVAVSLSKYPAMIHGYATIAAGQLEIEDVPPAIRKRLPRYPLPVIRLGRLAVDETARSQGLGKALLRFVFQLALRMGEEVGCVGVVVDAKPNAVGFYEQFGFKAIELVEGGVAAHLMAKALFLPLAEIQASLKVSGNGP